MKIKHLLLNLLIIFWLIRLRKVAKHLQIIVDAIHRDEVATPYIEAMKKAIWSWNLSTTSHGLEFRFLTSKIKLTKRAGVYRFETFYGNRWSFSDHPQYENDIVLIDAYTIRCALIEAYFPSIREEEDKHFSEWS